MLTHLNTGGKHFAEGDAYAMKSLRVIVTTVVLALMANTGWAGQGTHGRVQLLRDKTYEQNLRWASSADRSMTPAKVLRWITGLRGQLSTDTHTAEFQPSFKTENGHIRIIAAIAYKF